MIDYALDVAKRMLKQAAVAETTLELDADPATDGACRSIYDVCNCLSRECRHSMGAVEFVRASESRSYWLFARS
jgi:hypothetical protein